MLVASRRGIPRFNDGTLVRLEANRLPVFLLILEEFLVVLEILLNPNQNLILVDLSAESRRSNEETSRCKNQFADCSRFRVPVLLHDLLIRSIVFVRLQVNARFTQLCQQQSRVHLLVHQVRQFRLTSVSQHDIPRRDFELKRVTLALDIDVRCVRLHTTNLPRNVREITALILHICERRQTIRAKRQHSLLTLILHLKIMIEINLILVTN